MLDTRDAMIPLVLVGRCRKRLAGIVKVSCILKLSCQAVCHDKEIEE